ncbi:unnamed protein product [Fraxinus pennsylvanica]|uniref:Phytochrome chromophore attachment site domain-containing protein n=1 Tax=Fraxinus pennsylvanica TaxID=56036 RepID=A0AAD1Z208_9LAMI|nr:unnamed protein product [Fraxinus pennsylvanica]
MGLIGVDVRNIFIPSSSSLLVKAGASREISLWNLIWVHSKATQRPFYAILNKINSQKLIVKAVSRLQSLPGGDIGVLCDTVVEDVHNLSRYDRVVVYKFHNDNQDELVSKIRSDAFSLNYAYKFLMQAFGLQLYIELKLASLEAEKKILRTQTLLCDLLLWDIPLGIVTRSLIIINLV